MGSLLLSASVIISARAVRPVVTGPVVVLAVHFQNPGNNGLPCQAICGQNLSDQTAWRNAHGLSP